MRSTRDWLLCAGLIALSFAHFNRAKAESAYQVAWSIDLASTPHDWITEVAVHPAGGVTVSGVTTHSLFSPSAGAHDGFAARYDQQGNLLWGRQFGQGASDLTASVGTDASGNTYVGGNISSQAYLRKYAPNGDLVWSQLIDEPNNALSDLPRGIATDAAGNVYLGGESSHPYLSKHDSAGNLLWERPISNLNSADLFQDAAGDLYLHGWRSALTGHYVYKYNQAGDLLWQRQFGNAPASFATDLVVDAEGSVYLSGNTPSSPTRDMVLVKYASDGSLLWQQNLGTPSLDTSQALALGPDGNVYLAGYTDGELGGPNLGGRDAVLLKYDPTGNLIWSTQFGGSKNDLVADLAFDEFGNVFLGGTRRTGNLNGTGNAWLVKLSPVPEPSTYALGILGLVALFAVGRSKQQKK